MIAGMATTPVNEPGDWIIQCFCGIKVRGETDVVAREIAGKAPAKLSGGRRRALPIPAAGFTRQSYEIAFRDGTVQASSYL